MWIAKPVMALGEGEVAIWARIQSKFHGYNRDFPLSQTLTWAHASEALGSPAYLVMEPDLGIGGVLQLIGDSLECINGPLLNWDDPFNVTQEFATFAMGAAKACKKARKIALRPRWTFEHPEVMKRRLGFLPGGPSGHSESWTLQVPVTGSMTEMLARTKPRFRRSLRRTEHEGFVATWSSVQSAGEEKLTKFVSEMNIYGKEHQFFVPPQEWFKALLSGRYPDEKWSFDWVDVKTPVPAYQGLSSHFLIARSPWVAHYLFGYDKRGAKAPSVISPAAVAHASVMAKCVADEVPLYDLNGYLNPDEPAGTDASEHPYRGVADFKAQLGGQAVRYYCPRFEISA